MVASTVYGFEDQLNQICSTLDQFGYDVWNSHKGKIPVHPHKSNLENCLAAVQDCDVFFGIIRTSYGSSGRGVRSITHEEIAESVRLKKPRWFTADRDVDVARRLLKPYMFRSDGTRTAFKLLKNDVLSDLRVIDMYNDAARDHWVHAFRSFEDALVFVDTQFKDEARVRRICREMASP
ncbi:MAG: DUF4062 domain-containing protein [Planctomycetes bacterium]|nr:DUF4062 domain-containing protein [Planctomycetota bacterium]MBI3843798.1 DUF4062 domain-containing protein [Planctomycetota bacterium]